MACLISLYRDDTKLGRRELPVPFDENLVMVMKLPELNLNQPSSCPLLKGSDMGNFIEKCKLLTSTELSKSMKISSKDVFELISQNVPCVGCRRSVERLYRELAESGQDALYPLTLTQNGILELVPEVMASTSMLFILLKYYGSRLSSMVEAISTKSRQTRRCLLHSLDAHRARPAGLQWRPFWDSMASECRDELTLVEADTLLDTLEAYLRKHRFCPECRLKVLRAYSLLVGEVDPSEEKGYKPVLYLGLRCCPTEKHIHVQGDKDLISLLIARAEPELVGSTRERHAKTMEVAQEEVVTCVGICLLERLQRVAQRLKEEEQMVDILQYASLQALRRSFEMAVESKRGVSQLELLCEELSREEAAQKQRKEMKRLRRKKRRGKKDAGNSSASASVIYGKSSAGLDDPGHNEDDGDNEDEAEFEMIPSSKGAMDAIRPCHCHYSDKSTKSAKCSPEAACIKKIKSRVNNNNDDESLCRGGRSGGADRGSWGVVSRDHRNQHHTAYCYSPHCTLDYSSGPSSSSCSSSTTKHSNHNLPKSSKDSTSDHLQSISTIPSSQKSSQTPAQDSGYSSTNSSNLTTPEGSDVACTEGLCNHCSGSPTQSRPSPSPVPEGPHDLPDLFLNLSCENHLPHVSSPISQMGVNSSGLQACPIHFKLRDNCCGTRSLQEMLRDWSIDDQPESLEDDEESYIPLEEVQAFRKQQQLYNEQRLRLRHDLRRKFDQLCGRLGSVSRTHSHSN